MNAGVTWSGSPNQKARTSGSCMPALAMSRIFELSSARTAGRVWGNTEQVTVDRGSESGIVAQATSARSLLLPVAGYLTSDRDSSRSNRDLERVPSLSLRRIKRAVCAFQQRLGGRWP